MSLVVFIVNLGSEDQSDEESDMVFNPRHTALLEGVRGVELGSDTVQPLFSS